MKPRAIRPHSALRAYFGDQPIHEAKKGLLVVPNAADIRNAKPNNPTDCVFAEACKRAYGTDVAVFFRRFAYIGIANARTGEVEITRFMIDKKTMEEIEAFDAGKGARPGAFTLSAVRPTKTLYDLARYRRENPKKPVKSGKPRRQPQVQFRGRVSALAAMGRQMEVG